MFGQSPFDIKVEWGQRGAREASERGDIVIIVDVLSFSSTVVTAIEHGAIIYPHPPPRNERAKAYAAQLGAELIQGRAEGAKYGGHTLSPLSFSSSDRGKKLVMCSFNGAACTWVAKQVPALLIGSLLNASAVAETANHLRVKNNVPITVVPCGERWSDVMDSDNNMRPGIEDYLGVGLIVSKLHGEKSPEAQVCQGAYESAKSNMKELIKDCGSGRELRERGYGSDVDYCLQIDQSKAVPILRENHFRNASEVL